MLLPLQELITLSGKNVPGLQRPRQSLSCPFIVLVVLTSRGQSVYLSVV